jgi:hypothetical protein
VGEPLSHDDAIERSGSVPLAVFGMGVSAGIVLGALTNAVNGLVSPQYFVALMGWQSHVWVRAVGQGMLEGGVLGGLFGIVVAIAFAASTGLRGPLRLATGALAVAVGAVLVCWIAFGVLGVLIAATDRVFVRSIFIGVPADDTGMRRYAWVGGTIWGGYAGALVGAVAACVWQHVKWRRLRQRLRGAAFEVLATARPVAVARPDDIR